MTRRPTVTDKLNALFDAARLRQRLKVDSVPSVLDPFWAEFCRPLLILLLEKDREWHELRAWRRQKKINGFFLRNALAWLEEQGYAETYLPPGVESAPEVWIWRAVDLESTRAYTERGEGSEENLSS